MLRFLRLAIGLAFRLALCALFFLFSPCFFSQALALGFALRFLANALRFTFRFQPRALFDSGFLLNDALGLALFTELLALFRLELFRFRGFPGLVFLFFGLLREEQLLFALLLLFLERKLLGPGLLAIRSLPRGLLARTERFYSLLFACLVGQLTFAGSLLLHLSPLTLLRGLDARALARLRLSLPLLLRGEPCSLALLPLFGQRPLLFGSNLVALLLCSFALFQCQFPAPLAVFASHALFFLEFFSFFARFVFALFLEQ